MRPLAYWARAEGWRFRPTHKSATEINGTLIAPDEAHYPFRYDRQRLTLEVVGGPWDGCWQLDEWGVARRCVEEVD